MKIMIVSLGELVVTIHSKNIQPVCWKFNQYYSTICQSPILNQITCKAIQSFTPINFKLQRDQNLPLVYTFFLLFNNFFCDKRQRIKVSLECQPSWNVVDFFRYPISWPIKKTNTI